MAGAEDLQPAGGQTERPSPAATRRGGKVTRRATFTELDLEVKVARILSLTLREVRCMDFFDFLALLESSSKTPEISEAFYRFFCKPAPTTLSLNGPDRNHTIEALRNGK